MAFAVSVLNVFWQTYNLCTHFNRNEYIPMPYKDADPTKWNCQDGFRYIRSRFVCTSVCVFFLSLSVILRFLPKMHHKKVIRAKRTKASLDQVFRFQIVQQLQHILSTGFLLCNSVQVPFTLEKYGIVSIRCVGLCALFFILYRCHFKNVCHLRSELHSNPLQLFINQ